MKSARTLMALGVILLLWLSVALPAAFAKVLEKQIIYDIATPAPDGVEECQFTITVKKSKDTEADLTLELSATAGEAMIIAFFRVGSGTQPGCDIFPDSPSSATIHLGPGQKSFRFDPVLEVHAHPDADCTAAGHAAGSIRVTLEGPKVRKKKFKVSDCSITSSDEITLEEENPR